ncbi:MAG: aspartate aminotransferase family protein [Actinobacteria bacterium]|nr:aspartate aminotransferase family protein [Actinomycetota bacterium]
MPDVPVASEMQQRAQRHLWLQWTGMGRLAPEDVPVIVRGDGCYVFDERGRRYLDGLAGLFCVNAGHGRVELADVAAEQMRTLGYYPTWGYAHKPAIELAAKIAELTPGDLNRVFFTSGGSEAVESAIKLCRAYHRLNRQGSRTKIIARSLAYHGVTMGALSATGVPSARVPFEPVTPGGCHVANTNVYRLPAGQDPLVLADAIEERILFEGPETVSAVILEPVQNSGGCLTPPEGYFARVREICDRYGVLFISDETICAWGRLGTWFGSQRYDYQPDIITTAKGITSAYAPLGAMIVSDRIAQPFMETDAVFAHGLTFAGHPLSAAIALGNLEIFEREGLVEHVRDREDGFRARLEGLKDLPIVGDVRGAGYMWAVELVRDQDTKAFFTREQLDAIVPFISGELFKRGLICRTDDRSFLALHLAPPLVADRDELDEIEATVRAVLSEACERFGYR